VNQPTQHEYHITREDNDGLCILTLNRPEKLNALDTETFQTLEKHIIDIERSKQSIGCVVLRGAGRGFCAGADLNVMGQKPIDPNYKPGVIDRLENLPQPVISAVHGVCYTGGLELALTGDFIIADTSAKFADTHGKWGLVAAWGMHQRLQRRIGRAKAKYMMMTGTMVTAEQGIEYGLVDNLVALGELDKAWQDLATSILANSWHTNFAIKNIIRTTDGMPQASALTKEREEYPGYAPDYKERIETFKKNKLFSGA